MSVWLAKRWKLLLVIAATSLLIFFIARSSGGGPSIRSTRGATVADTTALIEKLTGLVTAITTLLAAVGAFIKTIGGGVQPPSEREEILVGYDEDGRPISRVRYKNKR